MSIAEKIKDILRTALRGCRTVLGKRSVAKRIDTRAPLIKGALAVDSEARASLVLPRKKQTGKDAHSQGNASAVKALPKISQGQEKSTESPDQALGREANPPKPEAEEGFLSRTEAPDQALGREANPSKPEAEEGFLSRTEAPDQALGREANPPKPEAEEWFLSCAEAPDQAQETQTMLERARQELADLRAARQEARIEAALEMALARGKIAPAVLDYHRRQCRLDGGLQHFLDYCELAPMIAAPSGLDRRARGDDGLRGETFGSSFWSAVAPEEREICRCLGISESELRGVSDHSADR